MYTSTENGKLMLVDGVYKLVKPEDVPHVYAQDEESTFQSFKRFLKNQVNSWFDV